MSGNVKFVLLALVFFLSGCGAIPTNVSDININKSLIEGDLPGVDEDVNAVGEALEQIGFLVGDAYGESEVPVREIFLCLFCKGLTR